MSRLSTSQGRGFSGFPRVSGDEPYDARLRKLEALFSPRERG